MNYLDLLKKLSINSAHPGGINSTKRLVGKESISKESSVLEIGCGTGVSASFIYNRSQSHITVIDQDEEMLLSAKARFELKNQPIVAIHASVESMPFRDETFDFVFSESVLAFADKHAISECYRVLNKGGRFIIHEMILTDQITDEELIQLQRFYRFKQFNQKNDWFNILQQSGFTHIEEESIAETQNSGSEFQLTDEIDEATWDILEQHEQLVTKFRSKMNSAIWRCQKE
ncbi:class I SAM-dependent methyltransferase [Halalkalibacter hemicellulosilyticus]|uniref:SAM-dependent methyltransferases n=1 Tax=Halalkalibacter hemicellulosilyticusJCM 9152 TaxID=1236971 RepID=W4QH02_9BACI|nr:class I SAM-dependent methyltransferase [Halalkalibacter hemicellulosilyticus]GAE30619.1 SAM-dependent methyltransferases [Halalkalibacter hemicellulosilyticusJCM 9152]